MITNYSLSLSVYWAPLKKAGHSLYETGEESEMLLRAEGNCKVGW